MKTISVRYNNNFTRYTFMCNDDTVKAGDFCVVKTSALFDVVKVDEVHEEPQLGGGFDYKWIVQKIDDTEFKKLTLQDHEGHPVVRSRL